MAQLFLLDIRELPIKELPINIYVEKVRKIGPRRRNTLPDNIIPARKRV